MANRPNHIFCHNKSPQDPEKLCSEIGPSIKYKNSRSKFQQEYRKKKNAANQRCNAASDKAYGNRLREKMDVWEKEADFIKKCLDNEELTEEEAIDQLDQKYNSIFRK